MFFLGVGGGQSQNHFRGEEIRKSSVKKTHPVEDPRFDSEDGGSGVKVIGEPRSLPRKKTDL